MITLRYNNAQNKLMPILLQKKAIKSYEIANGFIEIFFESIIAVKKDKLPVTYNWTFRVAVTKVVNFIEIEAFLKSIKNAEKTAPTKTDENTQSKLDF